MVAVIHDALLGTLKTAKTLNDIEELKGVTCIYGVKSIKHGMAPLGKSHWVKGFDENGALLCLIASVQVLEHVF